MNVKASEKDMVFRASAGTGKTYALVSKYLSELMSRRGGGFAKVDQLAAITFTDKAAAEMKERVRDRLTEKIDRLSSLASLANIGASSANLPEDMPGWSEDHRLLAHLISQRQALQGAYICTIHSFCARLLRENPVASGVDPAFSVLDDSEASALLEEAAHNVILQGLRDGDEGTISLVRDFNFESQGDNLPGLKARVTGMVPLIRAANQTPDGLLEYYERFIGGLERERDVAIPLLQELKPELEEQKKNTKAYKLSQKMKNDPELFASTENDRERAIKLAREADWVSPGSDLTKSHTVCAAEAARLLHAIAAPALEAEAAPSTKAFISILGRVMDAYSAAKEKRSALDYDDLQEKTRDLLRDDGEARSMYSGRFVRVLVDEFQDVNDLQQEIVTLLAPPGEGKLFIVGDVKQSIYGFRGADVDVFGKLAEAITKNGGREYALKKNYRSTPELIAFTNGFFPRLMTGDDGEYRFDPDKDSLKHRSKNSESEGVESFAERVEFEIKDGKTENYRALEARTIAARIADEVEGEKVTVREKNAPPRPAGYGDFALLLRTFNNLTIYENAFRHAGVPFQIVKGKGFYHSQEIRDFINILRLLDYSGDSLALMSVLRSPLVGVKDSALLALCRSDDGSRRDPSVLVSKGAAVPKGIDGEDREKIAAFLKKFHGWRSRRDRMMISELVESVLSETGYGAVMMSRFQGEQRLANLFKLIELARQYESDARHGFKTFIARLSKLEDAAAKEAQADVGGDNAVKIMTVHQSKGLEFPIVILGDIGADKGGGVSRMAFHHGVGLGLSFHDPETGEWIDGPMFRKVKEAKSRAETEEMKRLLYVGMTRAKDRLIISGSRAKSGGPWRKWVDGILDGAEDLARRVTITQPPKIAPRREEEVTPELVKNILSGYRPEVKKGETEKKPVKPLPDLRLSVTGLAALRHCPRLFYYQNVMELPGERSGAGLREDRPALLSMADIGSRVHALLEKAPLGSGLKKEAVYELAGQELDDLDPAARRKIADDISNALAHPPLSALGATDPEAIIRETPLAIRITEKDICVTLTGAADIVWFDGEKWSVADYKYSERPGDERRYLFQIKLYAYALMQAQGMDSMDAALVYLKEKEDPASVMTIIKADLKGIRKSVLDAARLLAKLENRPEDEWSTQEESFCDGSRCFYRARCFPNGGS